MRPTLASVSFLVLALGCGVGCKSQESAPAMATVAVVGAQAPLAAATPGGTPGPGAWLDPPFTNWNTAGQAVPRAPMITVDDQTKERCAQQNRPAASPEDKVLVDAGWTLFGPLQTFGKATMISALATVDVNCRPVSMQTFAFVDGKFAGTLAPKPMESRTDGAQRYAFLTGEDFLFAEFARYAGDDPACCPSRFATATYRILPDPAGPVLTLQDVNHKEAPKRK